MKGSPLPTRPLGSSGLAITRVGFGAWAAGGGGWSFGWGPQDDQDSLAAMRRAIERGVNWIDTAAVYGLGHSEEVVGRFLRGLPAAPRPLVFTKGVLIWDDKNPMGQSRRVLEPKSIAAECEASLRRLRAEPQTIGGHARRSSRPPTWTAPSPFVTPSARSPSATG